MSLWTRSSEYAAAVTPADTVLPYQFNILFVGGAGNITVTLIDGVTDVVFTGVLAGTLLPVRGVKVKAATTATNIVALW